MRRGISPGRAEQVSRQKWTAGFGSIGHRSDRAGSQFTSEEEQGVTRRSSDCSLGAGYRFTNWWDAPQQFSMSSDGTSSPSEIMRCTAIPDVERRAGVGLEDLSELDTEVSTRIMEGIIETIGEYDAVDVGVFDIVEAEPTG